MKAPNIAGCLILANALTSTGNVFLKMDDKDEAIKNYGEAAVWFDIIATKSRTTKNKEYYKGAANTLRLRVSKIQSNQE